MNETLIQQQQQQYNKKIIYVQYWSIFTAL